MEKITLTIENDAGRLDKYITELLKEDHDFSRSFIQKLIESGEIIVNGNVVSGSYNLLANDEVVINIPEPKELEAKPEEIDFDVIYEDDDLIVVNKPNNLVVHPGAGNPTGTLVNGLLFKIKKLSSIGGVLRPGIVHRLDKMTTGLMLVAKNDATHKKLTHMLANNLIKKEYLGIVHGVIEPNKGIIDAPIGRASGDRKKMSVTEKNSKHALTRFEVVRRLPDHTLVSCIIDTGRTHQIRVHMNYIKHPIVGDPLYAFKEDAKDSFGQYLHSHKLSFEHPTTNKKMEFIAEPPAEFNDKLKELEGSEE